MNNYTPNQGFLMEPIMDGTFDLLGGGAEIPLEGQRTIL